MLCDLNDLQRDVLSDLQTQIRWHTNLWYAPSTGILVVGRGRELEGPYDGMRVVWWCCLAFLLDANVDVKEGFAVSGKPPRLERKSTTLVRPQRAIPWY